MPVLKFKTHAHLEPDTDRDTLACKRLLVAILERALLDLSVRHRTYKSKTPNGFIRPSIGPISAYVRDGRKQAVLRANSALGWIMDPCPSSKGEVNSYEKICQLFGLDPALLRDEKRRNKAIAYLQNHHQD